MVCELKECVKYKECSMGNFYIKPKNCGLRREYLSTLNFRSKNMIKKEVKC